MKTVKNILLLFLFFNCSCFSYSVTNLIIEPDQGEKPIVNAINDADHSIDLVMYGFTDKKIRNAIINAKKRGVAIRIILEKEPYLSDGENTATLKIVKHNGIIIKNGSKDLALTHQKTLIIDNDKAWIMTMNFTRSGFMHQRNFGALITAKPGVNEIETIFNSDWQDKKIPKNFKPNLVWSPLNSRTVINQLILQARHTLTIYAPELSDYQIIGSLAKAAEHGVAVTLLMPAQQNPVFEKKLSYLIQHHVHVCFSKTLAIHAKMILADSGEPQQTAYLGSANLTTASLDNNRELGILINNPGILTKLHHTFLMDYSASTLKLPLCIQCRLG